MKSPAHVLAVLGLALGLTLPAQAADLLVLTDDVPAGLDFDGPTSSTIQSYTGIENPLEPLVYFADRQVNEQGIQLLDFQNFAGRLAESWSFDAGAGGREQDSLGGTRQDQEHRLASRQHTALVRLFTGKLAGNQRPASDPGAGPFTKGRNNG